MPSVLGSCKIDSEDLSVVESRANDVVVVVYLLLVLSASTVDEGGLRWAWEGGSFQDDSLDFQSDTDVLNNFSKVFGN